MQPPFTFFTARQFHMLTSARSGNLSLVKQLLQLRELQDARTHDNRCVQKRHAHSQPRDTRCEVLKFGRARVHTVSFMAKHRDVRRQLVKKVLGSPSVSPRGENIARLK